MGLRWAAGRDTRARGDVSGYRVAVALLLLCAAAHASTFSRAYSRRIWRVPDGLPQNRIQALTQTPDGYLWIGTSGGLVRFDGVRFTVFDRSNTPAFRDDSILALVPARDGSLWIGAEGGGLLHYRNGEFSAYGAAQGLTNGFVRAILEDRSGALWIGTDRGFFRKRGDTIERIDGTPDFPVIAITSMAADGSGQIWIASNAGLLTIENGRPRRFLPDDVRGLRAARDGGVWAVIEGVVSRIADGRVTRIPSLEGLGVMSLAQAADGHLWIGTLADGLLRAAADGRTVDRDPDALPTQTVLSTFEDRENNLWVGTSDGLVRLSRIAVHVLDARDGLSDDNVSVVYEGRHGVPWISTIAGRIFRYRDGRVEPFRADVRLAGKRYRVVYEDSRGGVWLGSSTEGVAHIAGGRTRLLTTADGLRNNQVRQFLEDRRGHIWIGLGSGLSRWDGQRFHNYYVEHGLSYGSVRILKLDRNGDLLVGTDAGLNRVHNDQFVKDAAFAALDGERIWAIHEDASGALWIGARGGGLFRIKNGKVSRITMREGLLSNAIYQVLEDGRGNLWMSGPAGVYFAPQKELDRIADGGAGPIAVVPYGAAEGLESTQMNGGIGPSGFRAASGDLWFPSVRGAVRINPAEIRLAKPSPVVIETIVADDAILPAAPSVVAPPGPGKLEIHYTATSLHSPERIAFRYRLEGFDPDWNAVSRGRSAYYTNLPPGTYRFRVVATDSAAPGSRSEAALSFTLRPHFHQTVWFYALCVAAAALCVWAAFLMYARQTRKRYAVLFAERTRLAREMHDTVIQGCAGVSTLLEAAASLPGAPASPVRDLIDHARVQARLTLDEARQAVWDLRHTQLEGDIVTVLRDFARQLGAEKGIPIDVEFSGEPPQLEQRTMRSLLLVAREAIRNAANHADPRHVKIRVDFEPDEARLEVADDGRGFNPSSQFGEQGHFGIVGMRERVEQLGGVFDVRSAPGRGTSVIARLPLGGVRLRRETVEQPL